MNHTKYVGEWQFAHHLVYILFLDKTHVTIINSEISASLQLRRICNSIHSPSFLLGCDELDGFFVIK